MSKRKWTVFLSGEVHSAWRVDIVHIEGASAIVPGSKADVCDLGQRSPSANRILVHSIQVDVVGVCSYVQFHHDCVPLVQAEALSYDDMVIEVVSIGHSN